MRVWSVVLMWMVATVAVACYQTPTPECAFSCGNEDACPSGYTCRPDGWCKREGVPDEFQCAPPRPDAMPVIDAGPDASPDASPDAAVFDAGFDASALTDNGGFSL